MSLVTRAAAVRTLDKTTRTMQVTAASETPTQVYDFVLGAVIDEVLLVDGFRLQPRRTKVPLIDAHDRRSIDSVIGSASGFRVDGSQIVAEVMFSDTPSGLRAMRLYEEGHLTDVSIGYTVDDAELIPEGKTRRIRGQDYVGPMRVVTGFTIKELSSVVVGADPTAKARSDNVVVQKEERMLEEPSIPAPVATEVAANIVPPAALAEPEVGREEAIKLVRDIELMGRRLGIGEDSLSDIKYKSRSMDEANAAFVAELARQCQPVATGIQMGETDSARFRSAAIDALLKRSGVSVAKPAPGADQMSRLSFEGIARECLRRHGVDPALKGKEDVLRMAHQMTTRAFPGLDADDFPAIMAGAANKAALIGFGQQPTTYQEWCRITSIPDFKVNSRIRLSDMGLLEIVSPQGEIRRGAMSESNETYRIFTYARIIGITREMQINDDLNVFGDMFQAFGLAAARTVNALPYAVLAANAAMGDGIALFHASRGNLAAPGTNPTSDSVSLARAAMRKQTGPQGMRLNIQPRYLLVGPDNADAAVIVLSSATQPSPNIPHGVVNPNMNTALVVIDAEIPGRAWYLAANPMIEPTMEVGFLNGVREPTLDQLPVSSDILGVDFRAHIDVGCKAVGWRGLYRNPGA